jgi:uncharacterized membrane protein
MLKHFLGFIAILVCMVAMSLDTTEKAIAATGAGIVIALVGIMLAITEKRK